MRILHAMQSNAKYERRHNRYNNRFFMNRYRRVLIESTQPNVECLAFMVKYPVLFFFVFFFSKCPLSTWHFHNDHFRFCTSNARFILFCSVCVCGFCFSSSSIVINLVVSTKKKNTYTRTGERAASWRYEFLIHFRINLHFGRRFKLLVLYVLVLYISGVPGFMWNNTTVCRLQTCHSIANFHLFS